jgi:PKD repeat protein
MVPAALPECGDDHDAADDQDECEDSSDYESEEYDKALAPSLLVAFDASASVDTDGTIESYTWDFGDGTTATGVTTTHTYTAAGAFTARLTITDNEGSTDTTTHEITVAAPGFGLRVTDDSGAVVWTVAGLFNNNKNVHVKYSSDGKVRKISGAATDVDPVGVRTNVSFSVIRTEHSSEYTGSIRIQRSDGAVKKFRFQVVGGVTTIAGGGATGQGSSKVCEDHDCAKWTLDWVVNKPLAVVHKERPSGSRGMTRAML